MKINVDTETNTTHTFTLQLTGEERDALEGFFAKVTNYEMNDSSDPGDRLARQFYYEL
jgi:hypothetical protein